MFNPKSYQNRPLAETHPSVAHPVCLICCLVGWPWFRCSGKRCFRLMVPNCWSLSAPVSQCFNDLILEYLRREIFSEDLSSPEYLACGHSVKVQCPTGNCLFWVRGAITGEKSERYLKQKIFCALKPPWTATPNLSHPCIKQHFVVRRQMTNQDITTTCIYVNQSANVHSVFSFQKLFLHKTAVWENLKCLRVGKNIILSIQSKIKWTCLRLYKVAWI